MECQIPSYVRNHTEDGQIDESASPTDGAANVPPKVAQTLARHSTISLTMDRYTHLGTDDLVAGLKRLPVMAGGNGATSKT